MDIIATKEKLKLLDELMEQTKYLSLWTAEGFAGPEQQKMFLHDRLVRAEQLLFEANVVLSRLCEETPINLKSRVSDKPVWLPAMIRWHQENSRLEEQRRKQDQSAKRLARAAENAGRREALSLERFVYMKLDSTGEPQVRLWPRMDVFSDDKHKLNVQALSNALPTNATSPWQFRVSDAAGGEWSIDWKPLTDCTALATFSKQDAPRLLTLYMTGVSEPHDKEAIIQLKNIVLERFPTFPSKKFLPLRIAPRPLALAVLLRNNLDIENDNLAMALAAVYFQARGGRHKGAG